MHAFLASLTAALLFIHAAFGCCWHHAHRCLKHSDAAIASAAGNCCDHHGHGNADEQPQPCDCHLECGSTCTYLLPQKISIDAPQPVAVVDWLATAPLSADARIVSAVWSLRDFMHGTAPRLRLHLLHQWLLN